MTSEHDESKDTGIRARLQGVAAQMKKCEYYYAITLSKIVLHHTYNLSKAL